MKKNEIIARMLYLPSKEKIIIEQIVISILYNSLFIFFFI